MKLPEMKLPDYRILAITAALVASPVAARAQMAPAAAPACAALDKSLPAPWSGWATQEPLTGGTDVAGAGKLVVGHIYLAGLSPSGGVTYAVPLPKPAATGTFAGVFALNITAAGTYSMALSDAAWIDVAPQGGTALTSVAHGHGPACTTIHKVVDFTLAPGTYVVQISGASASPITIGVEPKS